MTEAKVYVPAQQDFDLASQDLEFASNFAALADTLAACGHPEEVALLLSTCRNHFLVTNACFVDLRRLVGAGDWPPPFSRLVFECERRDWSGVEKAYGDVKRLVNELDAKADVWKRRIELLGEFRAVAEAQQGVARDRLMALLRGARAADAGESDAHGFLAVDVESRDACKSGLESMESAWKRIGAAAKVCEAIRAVYLAQREADMFQPERWDAEWKRLLKLMSAAADTLRAKSDGDGGLIVSTDEGSVLVPSTSADVTPLETLLSDICGKCRRLGDAVRADLQAAFRPNVARPPMPAPFVINFLDESSSSSQRSSIQLVPINIGGEVPQSARVALLHCGAPTDWYDATASYRLMRSGPGIAALTAVIRAAIQAARDIDADALVLPELFVPRSMISEVEDLARESELAFIGGLEFGVDRGLVVNEALICLPGMATAVRQKKLFPSVYEPWNVRFDSDGRIYVFNNTVLGRLIVLLCSDYLEADVVSRIAANGDCDTIIVCCANPYPELFTAMARGDAARLYSYVAVANNNWGGAAAGRANGDGSIIAGPTREGPTLPVTRVELAVPWEVGPPPALITCDLSLANLRQRENQKPAKGFFAPSNRSRVGQARPA